MRFRRAVEEDVDAIVPLVNAAYRGTGGRSGWTTEAHLVEGARAERRELLTMMADPTMRFELALAEDGSLLGSVLLRREPDETCYLGMLSVDPARQAGGVGKALMLRSEEIAREWGCTRMRITVLDARPELLAFYERRGFARTGRSHAFPETGRSRLKTAGIRLVELARPLA